MISIRETQPLGTAHLIPQVKKSRVGHIDVSSSDVSGDSSYTVMPSGDEPAHAVE